MSHHRLQRVASQHVRLALDRHHTAVCPKSSHSRLPKVARLVPRVPLDVAPQTRARWRHLTPGKHCVQCRPHVPATGGHAIGRPGVVKLPVVAQPLLRVKDVKLGGAGSSVGLRDGLRLVKEVGEGVPWV